MSTTDTLDRQNLVLRVPTELLDRIDQFTAIRGGSRHSAILYLLEAGIETDRKIRREAESLRSRMTARIDKLKRDILEP
jgi:hypothetical protein